MTSDLKCLRCHYAWKRRTWNRLPRQCPNCHRNDWNKPEVGPVGRPPIKVEAKVLTSEDALKMIKRAIGHLSADDEAISVLVESCYLIERETTLCKHYSSDKAKEVMPSDSIQQTNGDVSGEHRAEMMSTSAKPVVEPQYKHKVYGVTSQNMVPHVLTEDEMNSPPKAKGEVEAIVRKRYDDAVASLVRGQALPQDASTDELLDSLLQQMEGEDSH